MSVDRALFILLFHRRGLRHTKQPQSKTVHPLQPSQHLAPSPGTRWWAQYIPAPHSGPGTITWHSTHWPHTLGLATAGTRWQAQYTPAPHAGPGNSWHKVAGTVHTGPTHWAWQQLAPSPGIAHTGPTPWAWQQLAPSSGARWWAQYTPAPHSGPETASTVTGHNHWSTGRHSGTVLALAPHTLGPATAGTSTTHKSGGQWAKVHIYGQHMRPALSLYTKMWAAPKVLKWEKCTETSRHSSHWLGTAHTRWWVHTRPTHTGLAIATTNTAHKEVGNAKSATQQAKRIPGGVHTRSMYIYRHTHTGLATATTIIAHEEVGNAESASQKAKCTMVLREHPSDQCAWHQHARPGRARQQWGQKIQDRLGWNERENPGKDRQWHDTRGVEKGWGRLGQQLGEESSTELNWRTKLGKPEVTNEGKTRWRKKGLREDGGEGGKRDWLSALLIL